MAPALPRLGCWCIQVPRGSHPRKSCSASAAAGSSRPAPSPATHCVTHKLFWVVLRRLWDKWKEPLILVTPRTVVGWHRAGFRLYWNCLLYTSDAADEEDSVDLGGRRIIKKKKKKRKKK